MREKLKDGRGGSCHMRSSTQSSPLGVASGYAPGQIKICIFPQATPKYFIAQYLPSGRFPLRPILLDYPKGIASGTFENFEICTSSPVLHSA
ncbi:hypothetical protein T05_9104 [Trichinella murrelli]|uniref:Uncharacterized protein n=1 Tax=Trichinella murrelli TaxID=144512 RepID=A0A0V0T5C6_9BILA|nr:hypothetical protein T05_9104 [Trichinella murrelli]